MFLKVVPDNKNGKDGFYCSLVESKWENGRSTHVVKVLETTDFNQKMTTDFNQYKYHRI